MDERLKHLAIEALQHTCESEERQQALTELVDEMLRSRRICRSPRGQSLSGIYLEIYQEVRKRLLSDVEQAIEQYHPERTNIREWANGLRDNALKAILNNARLTELAREVQRHPHQSPLRQHCLRELVEAIRLSGKLYPPHRNLFSAQFYQLVYEDAQNKALAYVCQKIDNYDPQRSQFMTWVNLVLNKQFIQCSREFNNPNQTDVPSLDDLERMAVERKNESQTETEPCTLVRECIEEDPNGVFSQHHIRDRPDANFRRIALATMSEKKWDDISLDLNLKLSTLSSFFKRSCKKFYPIFKEYLEASK